MYRKAMGGLCGIYLFLFLTLLFLTGICEKEEEVPAAADDAKEVFSDRFIVSVGSTESAKLKNSAEVIASEERVREKEGELRDMGPEMEAEMESEKITPKEEDAFSISSKETEILERIVEAEAGCEDEDGKLLIANVVLNRVGNEYFPDTIAEVVFQKSGGITQFSPVSDGSYSKVKVSEESTRAVERALSGEDLSEGALYFAARRYADSRNMRWFDENLTFLFQHGGHEFFK